MEVEGAEMQYSQDTHPSVIKPKSQLQRFPPVSKRSKPHIGLPRPRLLHWEDEPPDIWLYRPDRISWETWKVIRNRNYTLKGCTENFTHSKIQCRDSKFKKSSHPFADPGETYQRPHDTPGWVARHTGTQLPKQEASTYSKLPRNLTHELPLPTSLENFQNDHNAMKFKKQNYAYLQ